MKPASTTRSGAWPSTTPGQRRVEGRAVGEGLVVQHLGGDAHRLGGLAGPRASARLLITATTRPGQSCASDARTIASRFEP